MLGYLIEFTPDDNGTLLVTCPAFPEVTTYGDDRAQAERNAAAAIEEAVAARISDGDPLPRGQQASPKPRRHRGSMARLPLLSALKAQLYLAMREAGVNRAELARRLGWHREQVDRLFRLDHASRLGQIEAAFAALDRDVDIRIRELRCA
jgi:antitoxin HicB